MVLILVASSTKFSYSDNAFGPHKSGGGGYRTVVLKAGHAYPTLRHIFVEGHFDAGRSSHFALFHVPYHARRLN